MAHRLRSFVGMLVLVLMHSWSGAQVKAPTSASAPTGARVPAKPINIGPQWKELSSTQRAGLIPLQTAWPSLDVAQKRKWMEIADKLPKLPAEEQQRVQTRMTEWARLSPNERSQARFNFQQANQVSTEKRQAKWQAYQALEPEKKRELADKAANKAALAQTGKASGNLATARTSKQGPVSAISTSPVASKPTAATKIVTPAVVQVQPGVTTRLLTTAPQPPKHQASGKAKLAGDYDVVDRNTLLPKKGPQAASAPPVAKR